MSEILESLEPVIKTIKITPKTKFTEMFETITRSLDTDAARLYINHYKQNPEGLKYSSFHLLDNTTHKKKNYSDIAYAIIDGGHRLTALWELSVETGEEFIIRAWIYDWNKFHHNRDEVVTFYELINKSRKQSKINILEANSFQSNWVKYFSKNTSFRIVFEQAVKHLSWTNIINAYLNAKTMFEKKKIGKTRGFEIEELKEEFINGKNEDMKEFHYFLSWWVPIAEAAKKEYKIGTLYSVPFLSAGFLIWLENPNIKPEDGEKLVRFPRFMKLAKFCHAGHFPELLKFILYAINYKNTRRRFVVLDEVGEETNIN